MDFTERKLPLEAHERLRRHALDTIAADRPLLAPLYVFLRKNQKFVSVKGPMDFLSASELEKLSPYGEMFSLPPPEGVEHFENAAIAIQGVLQEKPRAEAELTPTPFEISDQVLRALGPLWSPLAMVEPYFVWVFVQKLLKPLDVELLHRAREQSVSAYETAQIRSAWTVFLALHLGYCDLHMLERLRKRVFRDVLDGVTSSIAGRRNEVDELCELSAALTPSEKVQNFDPKAFEDYAGRVSEKLIAQLERVRDTLIDSSRLQPSVYGVGGFCNVG